MFKYCLLISLITCLYINASGQRYFEGTIDYQFTFESKQINNPEKILPQVLGEGSVLFFKEGNYKHEYKGGILEYTLYNRQDNKVYHKKRNNDTLYWVDCSKRHDGILDTQFTPRADRILAIQCDRMIIRFKDNSEVHYYNQDSIRIDPQWFESFKLNDQYLIDRRERSINLKSEQIYPQFTLIETAIAINRRSIPIEKFRLPQNVVLVEERNE